MNINNGDNLKYLIVSFNAFSSVLVCVARKKFNIIQELVTLERSNF